MYEIKKVKLFLKKPTYKALLVGSCSNRLWNNLRKFIE